VSVDHPASRRTICERMAEAKLFEALKLGKKIPESNTFLFQGASISS